MTDPNFTETNVTEANVRAELYNLRKFKNETVEAFNERFDSIVRKYETCGFGRPLEEVEKQSAYYNSVKDRSLELRSVSMFKRQQNKTNLTVEEIKSFLLQVEAEFPNRQPQANVAYLGRNYDNGRNYTNRVNSNNIVRNNNNFGRVFT